MREQHERHFAYAVLTANRCGEHEHLGHRRKNTAIARRTTLA
jgi:hypothetical protein